MTAELEESFHLTRRITGARGRAEARRSGVRVHADVSRASHSAAP